MNGRSSVPPAGGLLLAARIGEVRVKYYGMFDITKRTDVTIEAVVLAATIVLVVATFVWRPTGFWASNFLFANLPWFLSSHPDPRGRGSRGDDAEVS